VTIEVAVLEHHARSWLSAYAICGGYR
jgi:hypothetical protein